MFVRVLLTIVVGGVSSLTTSILKELAVIIELLFEISIKLKTIVYLPSSVKVALIGVVLVKLPCTAKPEGGPQYPSSAISYSVPLESVASIFGVAGPVISTLICTLV